MTRAKRTLSVSASEWYGENVKARGPSEFFEELAGWGESSTEATVISTETSEPAAVPGENPMLGHRLGLVRDWPGAARPDDADELFPQGWRRAAAEAAAAGMVQASLLDTLDDEARAAFDRLAARRIQLSTHLREREAADLGPGEEGTPLTVGVGGVVTYAVCPKRFYWSAVRPLPRFSGPAARIGTEIHHWIERRAKGQGQLLEVDDAPDLTDEELAGDPGRVERLRQAFLQSRFAERAPLFAERAFLLRMGASTVGGRIDAIYGEPSGPWEVVDWKTGQRPGDDDPLAGMQLDLYGLACVEIWRKRPEDLTLTYVYLKSGEEISRAMDEPEVVRARVAAALRSIEAGEFDPTPGPACRHCDFRSFCDAGQRWLEANG
jgi:DNA helicase-2/ATP-dependent DNA helicase PcrA